jgi:hypothetical protein
VTDRGRQLMRRPGFDRAMIRQAGQRIRQRKCSSSVFFLLS